MSNDFDLSQYEIEDFTAVTIRNAKGTDDLLGNDGRPVVIDVYSSGSKPGQSALLHAGRQSQLRLQGMIRGKTSKNAAEDAEQEQVDKLVAFTKSISPNFPVAPAVLYANPKLAYIRRQIEETIGDDANFAKASTSSSPSTSDNEPG